MIEQDFDEFLREHISGSGIRWDYAAVKLGVKYKTLLSWKTGKRTPNQFVQDAIVEKITKLFIKEEVFN